MKPLRILMLVSSLRRSGPIVVIQNLLRNIDRDLIEVHIVKLMDDEPKRSITSEFINDGFKVYQLKRSKLSIELFPKNIAKSIDELIEQIQPDILHIHGYQCNRAAIHLHHQIPSIETVHCVIPEDYIHYGKLQGNYMIRNHVSGLRKVNTLVAISDTVKHFCEKTIGHPSIKRIYNGVKTIANQSHEEARRNIGIDEGKILFTVVGSLIQRKDPLTVIESFKKAFPLTNQNVHLIFLGKGFLHDQCESLIAGDDRIQLLGWRPNVYDYIRASDYTICASHSEGFGLNFMESLVNGVPVIGTQIDAFNEFYNLFPDLKTLSFKPGDVNELTKILRNSLSNIINMKDIQNQALKTFSAKAMADNYTNLYFELARNDGGSLSDLPHAHGHMPCKGNIKPEVS